MSESTILLQKQCDTVTSDVVEIECGNAERAMCHFCYWQLVQFQL